MDTAGPEESEDDPSPRVAPLRLGEYELGAELGRGAMGVVYRAQQPRLRREVAVKVILASQFAGESARKRFLAEADLAAQFDHPNIVPIYEVGETPDGPFYVMKLIEGRTLAEELHSAASALRHPDKRSGAPHAGCYDTKAAARLVAKIARAVHHAHQRGVLHRDLKPGNILLDAQGEPHVADFGLARQLNAESSLTATGAMLGTPAYSAPELAAGERGVTTAADVWSLGAILFHLLTGRPPFMGTTAADVILGARSDEAPRLRSLNPGVPSDLQTICLKCLEKDPVRRYRSALELAEDLERWFRHEPIQARPVRTGERMVKWVRRHRAVSALSAILLVSLLVGGAELWKINRQLRFSLKAQKESLHMSLVGQARAVRQSGQIGQRFQALALLQQAAKLESTAEVRDEAITALGNLDLREISRHALPAMPLANSSYFSLLKLDASLKSLVVHDPQRGLVRHTLDSSEEAHFFPNTRESGAPHVQLSPDGRWFVAQLEKEIQLWRADGTAPEQRWPHRGDGNPLSYLQQPIAFCSDSSAVAVANDDGSIVQANLGDSARRMLVPTGPAVMALAFDPGGTRLAVVHSDTVEIRERETGKLALSTPLPGAVNWCAWSPDGKFLAVAFENKSAIEIKLAASGETLTTLGVSTRILRFEFHPKGSLFTAVTAGNRFWLWELPDTQPILSGPAHGRVLQFSADGGQLALANLYNELVIYEVSPSSVLHQFYEGPQLHSRLGYRADTSPDGRLVATADANHLRLWDAHARKLLCEADEPSPIWTSLLFHPDGNSIVFSKAGEGVSRRALTWKKSADGTERLTLGASESAGGTSQDFIMDITRKNNWLIYDIYPGLGVHFWPDGDARKRRQIATRPKQIGVFTVVSPDEKYAALYITPGIIEVWSIPDAKLIQTLSGDQFNAVSFTPDGHWLVAGTAHDIQLFEISTWRRTKTIASELNREDFSDLFCSPDGKLLIFQASTECYELHSTSDFTEVMKLQAPHMLSRHWVVWSKDSTRFCVLGNDNRLFEWNLTALRKELASYGLGTASSW